MTLYSSLAPDQIIVRGVNCRTNLLSEGLGTHFVLELSYGLLQVKTVVRFVHAQMGAMSLI